MHIRDEPHLFLRKELLVRTGVVCNVELDTTPTRTTLAAAALLSAGANARTMILVCIRVGGSARRAITLCLARSLIPPHMPPSSMPRPYHPESDSPRFSPRPILFSVLTSMCTRHRAALRGTMTRMYRARRDALRRENKQRWCGQDVEEGAQRGKRRCELRSGEETRSWGWTAMGSVAVVWWCALQWWARVTANSASMKSMAAGRRIVHAARKDDDSACDECSLRALLRSWILSAGDHRNPIQLAQTLPELHHCQCVEETQVWLVFGSAAPPDQWTDFRFLLAYILAIGQPSHEPSSIPKLGQLLGTGNFSICGRTSDLVTRNLVMQRFFDGYKRGVTAKRRNVIWREIHTAQVPKFPKADPNRYNI
ncbi:hypothetical protein C8R45DRAFT_1068806 [Mycena sanguinolenta]|nr:hypothetical protein C8R45DRAFT_1068806 [Mycena sanguinolenta]